MKLVLASTSAARHALLTAAGVPFQAVAPNVDETELKRALLQEGASPRSLADALAEAKAIKLSRRFGAGVLVLGADQILEDAGGFALDKPENIDRAAEQLRALRGASHKLISAAVIAENGIPVWRAVDTAKLTVRSYSDEFLTNYLAQEGAAVLSCVGSYRLEALGVQLFSRIDGDHFTILGLPLLALLDYLRIRGVIQT